MQTIYKLVFCLLTEPNSFLNKNLVLIHSKQFQEIPKLTISLRIFLTINSGYLL